MYEILTNDPESSPREFNVDALEGADTGSLSIEDVVLSLERVIFAAERETQVGEIGDILAGNCVLASPSLLSTDPEGIL